jgi:hypothetical protein
MGREDSPTLEDHLKEAEAASKSGASKAGAAN